MPKNIPPSQIPLSPSLGQRLRAGWLALTRGPTSSWLEAVETRDATLAFTLHQMGVSAKGLDASAIIRAVEMNGSTVLQLLLDSGANPNQKEREGMLSTPLHAAALSGAQEKVRMLVNAGANVNIKGNLEVSPLASVLKALPFKAPALPSLETKRNMVFCLLEVGASAKGWAFNQRESMLRLAPLDFEILDRLTLAGANPRRLVNPTPAKGFLPVDGEQALLFRAVEFHCLEKMDEFLGHLEKSPYNQGPHTQGRQGRTLVFEMIRAWSPPEAELDEEPSSQWDDLLNLMVARGHDLTVTDDLGNTILHAWGQALAPTFYACGKALLRRPESPGLLRIRNKQGKRPLDVLLETPDLLDKVPGGWEVLSHATQDLMEEDLDPAIPVRRFHLGGRL